MFKQLHDFIKFQSTLKYFIENCNGKNFGVCTTSICTVQKTVHLKKTHRKRHDA